MKFLDNFFGKIFKNLENEKVSIWYYICSFIFIVLLRDFLEFNLYRFPNVDLELVLHFSLYYIAIALSAIVLLRYLTREKISKISRAVLPSFILLFTPIIIDFIISIFHSNISAPAYIYPDGILNGIKRFFIFFGPTTYHAGITIGMKVEVAILLFLVFFYLRHKKSSFKKSILGAFLFYMTIFLSFVTPSLIYFIEWISYFWIFAIRGISVSIDSNYSEFVFVNFFLIIIFILSIIIFRTVNKKLFEKIFSEIKFRFSRILYFAFMAILGIAVASKNFGSLNNVNLPLIDYVLTFFCLILSVACFFIFSCLINNIVDFISDVLSGHRPVTYQKKNEKKFLQVMTLIFLFGIFFALAVNYKALLILICFTGAYFIYSVPPFRFKKAGVFSKLIISLNSLLLVLSGYLSVPNTDNLDVHSFNVLGSLPLKYVLFVLCFTLPINYIDLKDVEGDRHEGIKTLPVLIGLDNAKMLVGFFFLALYMSTYFIFESLPLLVLFTFGGVIQFFILTRKKYSDSAVTYSYLAGIAVFIFFVFYLKP